MRKRILGKTGLEVSRLGAGLAEIGFELRLADVAQAAQVLNTALDGGITFLDTAATTVQPPLLCTLWGDWLVAASGRG